MRALSKLAFSIALVSSSIVWAKPGLEYRVEQLENIVNNQFNLDTLEEVSQLRQEFSDLRGNQEMLQHEVQQLREQNKELLNMVVKAKEPAKPRVSSVAPKGTDPRGAYDHAYALVEAKEFVKAQTAFQDFIWQYPESELLPNAHYWLGEVVLTQWQQDKTQHYLLQEATDSFQLVVTKYPKHHKAADSLLKLGLVAADNANWEQANTYLSQLVKEHPDSSRAQVANAKLNTLIKAGKIAKK